jgi:hypothetical protein
MSWREQLKNALGPSWTTRLRVLSRGGTLPRWGNLRRTHPLSTYFGSDRGAPIDRYYLHRFLDENRWLIAGDVLEIQTSAYTRRYGRDLGKVDNLDINPQFKPTWLCDLAAAGDLVPPSSYDCFLLPNTLQHLRDLDGCLRAALRIVRPGGTLLASAAGFVPLIPDGPDYWRLSADGWREVTARCWPGSEIAVEGHGNCLAAAAALYGIAVEELSPRELDAHDPRYPVLITIRCKKGERG